MRFTATFLYMFILLSILVNISGCSESEDFSVIKQNTNYIEEAEEILINNCGSSASAEQTTQRSEVIELEMSTEFGINVESLIYANIEAAYKNISGVVKSHTVTAAPKSNMRFVLVWKEQVDNGLVVVQEKDSKVGYKIRFPISVQQVLAEDLHCNITTEYEEANGVISIPEVREYEFQVKGQTATWGPMETGIFINRGDEVEISYISGSWWIGKTDNNRWISHFPIGPEGYIDQDVVSVLGVSDSNMCRPMISAPFGSLIGSIGRYKKLFYIGKSTNIVSDTSDILYLRINYQDHNQVHLCPYGDGGLLTIRVTVSSPSN